MSSVLQTRKQFNSIFVAIIYIYMIQEVANKKNLKKEWERERKYLKMQILLSIIEAAAFLIWFLNKNDYSRVNR